MSFVEFGQIVKARREELGLTQEKLAAKMGVGKATITRIELAQVSDIEAGTLYALAKALKWDPYQTHQAYQGKPPSHAITILPDSITEPIRRFLRDLPQDLVQDLLE